MWGRFRITQLLRNELNVGPNVEFEGEHHQTEPIKKRGDTATASNLHIPILGAVQRKLAAL